MTISRPVSLFMTSAPVLLMVTIAFTARLNTSFWTTPEYGPKAHKDLLEYCALAKEYKDAHKGLTAVPPKRAKEILADWIAASREGRLHPVPGATAADLGADGVRYEIANAKAQIIQEGLRVAEAEMSENHLSEAHLILNQCLELSNVCKYMSPTSAAASAQVQKRSILLAAKLASKGDQEMKDSLYEAIGKLDFRPELIGTAVSRQVISTPPKDAQKARQTTEAAYSIASHGPVRILDVQNKIPKTMIGSVDVGRLILFALNQELGAKAATRTLRDKLRPSSGEAVETLALSAKIATH